MADPIKFTSEEIQEIQNLQQLYAAVVNQAGQVHLEEITLHERKGQVEANFEEVKRKEQEILSNLNTKYGQGSINLETGEFTPVDTE
tara:strand:+ start:159 stop:419 length:261 start_codon:yes stop_codon:yes gene_type:complete